MELYEFLSAAREFAELGNAVREQFEAVLDGEPLEDQNPNALRQIAEFLQNNKNRGWGAAFDEWGALQTGINNHLSLMEAVYPATRGGK